MADNDWIYNYPSTTVRRTVRGDPVYANQFIGEANKLLWQTKNRMKLGGLGQLKATRYFNDGTMITAMSVFGNDFIEIVAGRKQEISPTCSITFFDLPTVVPPMSGRYSTIVFTVNDLDILYNLNDDGSTGSLLEEGYEYIKTYYAFSQTDCPECPEKQIWSICETEDLDLDITGSEAETELLGLTGAVICRPYTFEDSGETIYSPIPTSVDGFRRLTPEVAIANDHCVWSLWAHCQAEILHKGSDSGGTYIMWRAYTEWSNVGRDVVSFSKTGLGYLNFSVNVNPYGQILCETENYIKVDCCEKRIEDRRMIMNWTKCTGMLDTDFCAVPETAPYYYFYTMLFNQMFLMAYPDRDQNCPPYEWSLSGFGKISVDETSEINQYCLYTYDYNEVNCFTQMKITVRDRCGEEDSITIGPCCDSPEETPLVLSYATLSMQCSDVQNLTVSGGCPPYSWSVAGGGTITPAADHPSGDQATYEAPDNNANCANNGTVTVTDCCGKTASVGIAVNCYGGAPALAYYVYGATWGVPVPSCTNNGCYEGNRVGCAGLAATRQGYDCEGLPFEPLRYSTACTDPVDGFCSVSIIPGCSVGSSCSQFDPCTKILTTNENCSVPGTCGPGRHCGDVQDKRSAAMKAAGCCPTNPETGLPF